jgi:hypothetical protein
VAYVNIPAVVLLLSVCCIAAVELPTTDVVAKIPAVAAPTLFDIDVSVRKI